MCVRLTPGFSSLPSTSIQVVGDSSQEAAKLMKREGVRSVPAFHFWKGGKKVDTVSGANSEALENGVKDFI